MCGIAGALNCSKISLDEVYGLMRHRGPDDKGMFCDSTQGGLLQLFHARLSIQDLSALAHQPMVYQDLSLIFNGEIYNHLALREGLEFDFKTHSDTETLLALFAKFGEDFLEHLNRLDGMFAFVLYDKKNQKLYFARDRMGKKPLFCYKKDSKLVFASELNMLCGILKLLKLPLEIDFDAINFYLQSGFFYQDGAPYQNVFAIPNAHYGILDLDTFSLTLKPYFKLESCYKMPKINDEKEALGICENLLKQSIQMRIESSDLEVGAFLSGGIDSSLIVALASQMKPNLRTFTISFEKTALDESSLAQNTARKFGTSHQVLRISTNLTQDVPKILQAYGRPFFDSSAIPSFYVAKAAREHLSVVLNGDGADELFGGYRRYVGHLLMPKVLPFVFVKNFLPNPQSKQSLYNYFYRLLQMAGAYKCDVSEYYLSASTDIFTGFYSFKSESLRGFQTEVKAVFEGGYSPLSQMLLLDSSHLLLCDLLPKMDIATMSHSLEARSPFLSKGLVEFAPTLADNLKVRGKTTKYLLRKLAQKYLTKEVVNAPKRGFEVPLSSWVDGELKECILDSLQNPKISHEFLPKSLIESLCNAPQIYPREKRAKMLWSLFALEIWNQHLKENQWN